MGSMIPKEMKYNMHYGKVRGDVLRSPHDTNTKSNWNVKYHCDCQIYMDNLPEDF